MLEIKITSGFGYFNLGCDLCGGPHETGPAQSRAYKDGDEVGLVCETCVASGPAGMAARMREHASHLESAAAELRRLAAGEISSATIDDLQSAKDAFDAAFLAEYVAEHGTEPDEAMVEAATRGSTMDDSLPF